MKPCLICGQYHEKGTPCDLTGVDPILNGRYNLGIIDIEETAQEAYNVEQIRRKRGRPSGKRDKE